MTLEHKSELESYGINFDEISVTGEIRINGSYIEYRLNGSYIE